MKTFGEQDHDLIFKTNAIKKINYGGINSIVHLYILSLHIYILNVCTHSRLIYHGSDSVHWSGKEKYKVFWIMTVWCKCILITQNKEYEKKHFICS